MTKHYIIYSHGFGVDKTDRGLMADIAAALPSCEHVMFDYNSIDVENSEMTVSPFDEQVVKLQSKLAGLPSDAVVDIVAHSQGCIIASLAKPQNIRRAIFLTPPDSLDIDEKITKYSAREGSYIDVHGESRLPRRDGSTTIIRPEFWESMRGIDIMKAYNEIPQDIKTTFIVADADEVLGKTSFEELRDDIQVIELPGNHDFAVEYRAGVVSVIKDKLMKLQ